MLTTSRRRQPLRLVGRHLHHGGISSAAGRTPPAPAADAGAPPAPPARGWTASAARRRRHGWRSTRGGGTGRPRCSPARRSSWPPAEPGRRGRTPRRAAHREAPPRSPDGTPPTRADCARSTAPSPPGLSVQLHDGDARPLRLLVQVAGRRSWSRPLPVARRDPPSTDGRPTGVPRPPTRRPARTGPRRGPRTRPWPGRRRRRGRPTGSVSGSRSAPPVPTRRPEPRAASNESSVRTPGRQRSLGHGVLSSDGSWRSYKQRGLTFSPIG